MAKEHILCRFCGELHRRAPLWHGTSEARAVAVTLAAAVDAMNRPVVLSPESMHWFCRMFAADSSRFRLCALSTCRRTDASRRFMAGEAAWEQVANQLGQAGCVVVFGMDALRTLLGKNLAGSFSDYENEWIWCDLLPRTPVFVMRHPDELCKAAGNLKRQEDLWHRMRESARLWRTEFLLLNRPSEWMSRLTPGLD